MTAYRLFLSSVQKEFVAERRAVKSFIDGDPLLRRFFSVFLFEDLPARDHRPDAAYLDEVDRCAVYVGLFGRDYGFEDASGLSPTEREFDRATAQGKPRLIFVAGTDDAGRDPKMQALIRKAGAQLIRKRFNTADELTRALNASLVEFLEERGAIQGRPFEERPGTNATVDDIDSDAVARFVRVARNERQFALREGTPVRDVLAHLNLLHADVPSQAALLLFGRTPQRFVAAAEVRCMHFHGIEVQRPAPSYQIFKGTVFEQVDRAADFVLSVLTRSVGTRAEGAQAPVNYEIPPDVVREAIVNAVAHRDYTSGAAVQVAVFADRFEVSNPGTLSPPLTPESLSRPHNSIARNPRICDALFLARYIEKFGTGTLMMIRKTAEHALPAPEFEQRAGEFVTTVWRDWLTDEVTVTLELNSRQALALTAARAEGQLTNARYQQIAGATRATAKRDLEALVNKGVLLPIGAGRGAAYVLPVKRPIIGSIGSPKKPLRNGSKMAQMAHRSRAQKSQGDIEGTSESSRGRDKMKPAIHATIAPNAPRSLAQAKQAVKEPKRPTKVAPKQKGRPKDSQSTQTTHAKSRARKR